MKLVIIGAGPGGYTAALRARSLGAEVTLIDRDEPGGTCLARGCIPSKIMRQAADLVDSLKKASDYGITPGDSSPLVDLTALRSRQASIISGMQKGLTALFKARGIAFVRGRAEISAPAEVTVQTPDGETVFQFDKLLIATGSRPSEIPGAGPNLALNGKTIISSDEALSLTELPARLLVVGGGVIGCELAQIYHSLGTEVSMVEALDRILPLPSLDEGISKTYMRSLKKARLPFYTGYGLADARSTPEGICAILKPFQPKNLNPGPEREVLCDKILICTGRAPLADEIGLADAGVALDSRGWVEVDGDFKTSTPNISAIGDCLGPAHYMLAHTAQAQGRAAVEAMFGETSSMNLSLVPATIFTYPEIACVGPSLREAEKSNPGSKGVDILFRQLGKAQAMGEPDGLVRIVSGSCGKVLGGQIIGAQASSLIAEIALAANAGLHVTDIARTIHAHPTLAEGVWEAALASSCHALHG